MNKRSAQVHLARLAAVKVARGVKAKVLAPKDQ